MVAKNDLSKIKQKIEPYVGSRVRVRANKGRKKIVENHGILESTYPSIFAVKIHNEYQDTYQTVCYSYADLLTNTVQLSLCEE